ncbi:MAG: hypothetical protein R2697_09030 [Ilumatobacteraceae bacterium]
MAPEDPEPSVRTRTVPALWWACAAYTWARLLLAVSSPARTFADSASFDWSGWGSTVRPLLPSMLFDALGPPAAIVLVNALVAGGTWSWLLVELWRTTRPVSRSLSVSTVAVLAIGSLSAPVVVWDRMVLSESLAYSMVAAIVAALLRFLRTGRRPVAGAWVLALCFVSGAGS